MSGIDSTELAFQIQSGRGDRGEIRKALVGRYAAEVYALAWVLQPEQAERADEALGVTAAVFRQALDEPSKLAEYDSIRNWLFALTIGQSKGQRGRAPIRGVRIPIAQRLAIILRYGHGLSVDDIAEVLGRETETGHRHLRRGRRKLAGLRRPFGGGHIGREIEDAVDERTGWTEIAGIEHLEECAECRQYLAELQDFGKRFPVESGVGRPAGPAAGSVEAILESLDSGETVTARARGLPVREAAWAAGAAGVFLLLFQLLNPILSIEPPAPTPTPTLPPAEPAFDELSSPDYALLQEELVAWERWTNWVPASTAAGVFPSTTGISFSENGHYAAFGSYNDVVLWDLGAEIELPMPGHETVVTALTFGGETWLASGSEDGTVRVWDIADLEVLYVLEDAPRPVSSLAFSPNHDLLAVGGNSGIKVWRLTQSGMQSVLHLEGEFVRSLAFSPQRNLLAAVDRSGTLTVWETPEFTQRLRFAVQQRFNTGISFSDSGNLVATSSMDGTVKVFQLRGAGESNYSAGHEFTFSHPTWVSDMTWLGDELLLAVAGSRESSVSNLGKRGVYFWEMSSGLPASPALFLADDGGVLNVRHVRFNDEDLLYLGSYNRSVHGLHLDSPPSRDELVNFYRLGTSLITEANRLPTLTEPGASHEFPLVYQTAIRILGYTQLIAAFTEAIPNAIIPQGASIDPDTGIATFAFTREYALDHDEWIFLRIRPVQADNDFPFLEDRVSPAARVETIQFGRYVGEKVTGEWRPADVDGGAPGILRWTDSPLTRFRWTQDGYLFEVLSRSEIGTESSRWTGLFLPIILAMVGVDQAALTMEYEVVEGDTCTAIADRFGTTVGRIVELNDLTQTCIIFSGQAIRVPLPPAFGLVLEQDFDCDAVVERLRTIPDPRRPNSDLFLGYILEDVPGEGNDTGLEFAPFWTFAVPEIAVDFFDAPVLLSPTGGCGAMLAVTGYGGTGEDSGLRIFRWDGASMELLLHSRGFLVGDFWSSDGELSFDTRSLDYDQAANACTETITTYAWQNGDFVEIGEAVTAGLECFSAP